MNEEEMLKWLKVRSKDTGDCWLWTMSTRPCGLPVASIKGKRGVVIRRWIWETMHGKSLGKLMAVASCANIRCVNPEHVRAMNHAQKANVFWQHSPMRINAKTRIRKALVARRNSPLTEADVAVIRQRRAEGQMLAEIAKDFGVASGTISKIVRHESWRDYSNPYLMLAA